MISPNGARRAGFELAVAHDLFVHHFGSRTFAGNGIDAGKILDENAGRFAAKWGLRGTNGQRIALRPWKSESHADLNGGSNSRGEENLTQSRKAAKNANGPVSWSNGDLLGEAQRDDLALQFAASAPILNSPFSPLRLCVRSYSSSALDRATEPGERARVSLTMIVRDEENNLSHCLESVRGTFDEIVVVDTGSTDRTVEIARSFGAKVFEFEWVDSFAAARNEALSHATGDYAFWLDADDLVEPRELEKLRALLGRLRAGDHAAYVVALRAAIPARTVPAARLSSTTSGSFRCAMTFAGLIAFTNRFYRRCAGPTCRCSGQT